MIKLSLLIPVLKNTATDQFFESFPIPCYKRIVAVLKEIGINYFDWRKNIPLNIANHTELLNLDFDRFY